MKNYLIFITLLFIIGCAEPEKTKKNSNDFPAIPRVENFNPNYSIFNSSKNSEAARGSDHVNRDPKVAETYELANFNVNHIIAPSDKEFIFVIDSNLGLQNTSNIEFIKAEINYNNKIFNCDSTGIRIYCRFGLTTSLGIYPEYGKVNYLKIRYSSNLFDENKYYYVVIDHNKRFEFSITTRDNIATYSSPDLRANLNFKIPKNKILILASKQSDGPFVRVYVDGSFYWIISSMIRKYGQ